MKTRILILFCFSFTSFLVNADRKHCEARIHFYLDKCAEVKDIKDDNYILHTEYRGCGKYGEKIDITFRNVPSAEPPLFKSHRICTQELNSKRTQVRSNDQKDVHPEVINVTTTEIDRDFDNTSTKESIYESPTETRRTIYPDKNYYLTCTTTNDSQTKCFREVAPKLGDKTAVLGIEVSAPSDEKLNEIRKGAPVSSMTKQPSSPSRATVKPPGAT